MPRSWRSLTPPRVGSTKRAYVTAALAGLLVLASASLACKSGAARRAELDGAAWEARENTPAPGRIPAADEPPTYWSSVAPVLEAHCTTCHAPGGIGPMALTTYEQARENASAMALETRARKMPPWLPDTTACAPLRHSRALAEEDITMLERWAEAGAPEGRREAYRAPAVAKTYASLPPEPDRVVSPAAPYLPRGGRSDDYHCFVIDPKLDRRERVIGLRVVPGAPAIVHHVVLYEVRHRAIEHVRAREGREPGPGYTCFGGIGVVPSVRGGRPGSGELIDFDAQMVAAWAPGGGATDEAGAPTALPDGTAIHLAPGSALVLQVHYSMDNWHPGLSDRTRIDMWLAKDEPRRQAVWVPLLEHGFRVPAGAGPGDPRATARAEIGLPLPLTVLGVAPHMHLRGRSIRVDALGPKGAAARAGGDAGGCLLDVPRWDFHHQEAYWFDKGTRIDRAALTCTWDNRAEAQPIRGSRRATPKPLRWGEGTDDEMCLAFLYATLF
jgi:hypothetical protein